MCYWNKDIWYSWLQNTSLCSGMFEAFHYEFIVSKLLIRVALAHKSAVVQQYSVSGFWSLHIFKCTFILYPVLGMNNKLHHAAIFDVDIFISLLVIFKISFIWQQLTVVRSSSFVYLSSVVFFCRQLFSVYRLSKI